MVKGGVLRVDKDCWALINRFKKAFEKANGITISYNKALKMLVKRKKKEVF